MLLLVPACCNNPWGPYMLRFPFSSQPEQLQELHTPTLNLLLAQGGGQPVLRIAVPT